MLNVSQSLLHPDQYRFGIKSPVLLYSLSTTLNHSITDNSIAQLNSTIQLNRLHYYDLQLETALCYQHYFCNTELRTAIITEIKGLSIQTQQNTFVLFTLFKLTLDERKTLTKILMRKTSHNHSPNQRKLRNEKTSKKHNWWRIRSIRISSRNNGRIKKTTRLVLYQAFRFFVPD